VTVNLRKLLAAAMKSKRSRYAKYIENRALNECWPVLHNNLFDFAESSPHGVPDRRWFEEYSAYELQEQNCPFDKVLFNLEHRNRWYDLFNKSARKARRSVTRWPTIIFREVSIKTSRGVNTLDFRNPSRRETFE
jgi:hypothetical protein